jgi:hypothetical protein
MLGQRVQRENGLPDLLPNLLIAGEGQQGGAVGFTRSHAIAGGPIYVDYTETGSRRNDPATAIGAPSADTNRGFRVSRSIFDATHHVGVFVVPVAPRERPWFPSGGLQGRLVGSTAVRFFDANDSGRLIPSAGAARHHSICPGPTPNPKSTAKPTDGIRKGQRYFSVVQIRNALLRFAPLRGAPLITESNGALP